MHELLINRHLLLDLEDAGGGTSLDAATRRRLSATISKATSSLRLHVERPGEQTSYEGWLSTEAVVIHVDASPDRPVPAWHGPASALPSIVSLLTGMGERLLPTGRRAVTTRAELGLAVGGQGQPIGGFGPVVAVWTLEWSGSARAPGGLSVVDQGPRAMIWRVADATTSGRVDLEEAGSYDLWCRLGEVLALVTSAGPVPAEGECQSNGGRHGDDVISHPGLASRSAL